LKEREIKSILEKEGISVARESGQNFLIDDHVLAEIVKAAELNKNDLVLEIGPGLGVLTKELLKFSQKVVAVERDKRLFNYLKKNLSKDNLELINADFLKFDVLKIFKDQKFKVVANIPYYITGKILRVLFELKNKPKLIVLLVQKEVAQRVCAKKGDLSVLAIMVQTFAEGEIARIVKNTSFWPIPEVDSAILKMRVDESFSLGVNQKEYFKLVKIGFSSRRKTILNNLRAGMRLEKEEVEERLKKIGIEAGVRAQTLDRAEWRKMSQEFEKELKL
jgi:16S rRNA (adenine1518-N6/adenine1519-N6)-dimethyltransferase